MNSNWFKLVMKMTKVEYGKNLLLKGVPIIFNKGGAKLKIGENVTIKSSFLSNLLPAGRHPARSGHRRAHRRACSWRCPPQ